MRIVFFGTPENVLPVLDKIHKTFYSTKTGSPFVAVVTQKPKPAGRKKILTYSPVDKWAYKKKIAVFYNLLDLLKENLLPDLGILAAYGEIIPKEVLKIFPHGILNIHPSLLPKFRGASPVQATIISGEKESGLSIIKLDEHTDHGPIVAQVKEVVSEDDTTGSLTKRLFEKSARVLADLIDPYIKSKITLKPQDHSKASYTTRIIKIHGFIPPKLFAACLQGLPLKGFEEWKILFIKNCILHTTCHLLHNFIRAMNPWPCAWTEVKISSGKDIKILRMKILSAHVEELVPNRYCLVPDLVQLEGKDPVLWKQFKEAYAKVVLWE